MSNRGSRVKAKPGKYLAGKDSFGCLPASVLEALKKEREQKEKMKEAPIKGLLL